MRRGPAIAAAVVVLLVGDLAVTVAAERRAAAALCGDPDVQLGPWPVTPRVLAGGPVAFTAEFDAADLAALVPRPPLVEEVTIRDGRLQLATSAGLTVPAEVTLTGDAIVLTPAMGPIDLDRLAIRVALDALPDGLTLAAIEVGDRTVTATGAAAPRELAVSDGPPTCPIGSGRAPSVS